MSRKEMKRGKCIEREKENGWSLHMLKGKKNSSMRRIGLKLD